MNKFLTFIKAFHKYNPSLVEAIIDGYKIIYESENDPFPNSIMRYNDGSPIVFYHGSTNDFDEFDDNRIGSSTDAGWLGRGFYFYTDKNEASQYGKVSKYYLNIQEPYYVSDEENEQLAELNDPEESAKFTHILINDGYDSVFYNGNLRGETVVFNKNQIKKIKESIDESINAWNPNVSPVSPYSSPVGEPMGDWKNIMKQLPSPVGALGSGGSSAGGNGSYKYGPSLANPTRNLKEETMKDWEDAPNFPKFVKHSSKKMKNTIKKANEHIPLGAETTGDQINYYTNMDHMGMYDMDMTKQGAAVGNPGP